MPRPKPQYLENGDPELMDPNELEMASGQNTQDPRLAFDPHVYQDPDGSISNSLDDWMVAQNLAKRGAGLNYGPKTPTPSPASVAAQPKGYEPPPQMTKWSQALTGRLDDQGQPVPYDPKDITTGPPQMKEPKWWQRALAVGAGGAAGFANAMGKRAPAIDVGSMGENILHPGYGEQMAEWKQRVAPLQAAAQIAQNQQQAALQQGIGQSTIERNKAQGQYYSGQGRGSMLVTQAISDASGGELPVGTMQPYQGVVQVLSQNKGTVVIDADTAAMTGLKEGSRQPTSIVSTQLKARSGMVQITDPETATALKKPVGDWVSASTYKLAFPASGKQDPNDWINIANDETKPADVRARAQKNYDTYMKGQMRLHPTNINNITIPGYSQTANPQLTGDEYLKTLPPNTQREVLQAATGGTVLSSYMLTRNPQMKQLWDMVLHYDPSWNQQIAQARNDIVKQYTNTSINSSGGQLLSLETLIHHADLYRQVGDALKNGQFQKGNEAYNAWVSAFGSAPPQNAALVAQFLAGETAKVATGGVPGEQEVNRVLQKLSTNASPEQIQGAGDTMLKIATGRAIPLIQRAQHYKVDKVVSLMGEDSKSILASRGYDPDTLKQVGGGGQQGGKISVTAPDGSVHPFDTLEQANMFKKLAGIK